METKPLSNVFKVLIVLLLASGTFARELVFEQAFSAKGNHDIVVPLKTWGRFSFQVENPEGTAIELIDKKIGSRQKSGIVGESNGRIDDYMDVGEYKINTVSSREGSGKAKLKVYSYTEINSPQYIKPLKQYEGVLKDLEKASYWLYVPSSKTIYLEVVGRTVDDIQIWRNGQYREACAKTSISSHPIAETPLEGYRVVQTLEAGYYQITVYGGKPLDWSLQSKEYPFYLKMDERVIAPSGMGHYTIGDKGYEQFLVSTKMKRAIVSSPKKENIRLDILKKASSPSFSWISSDSIHEKSREPRCIVRPYSSYGTYVVKVSGKPGTSFTLQTFEGMESYLSVDTSGDYWVSTMHSGYPQDMLGVSGGIIKRDRYGTIIASEFDTLSNTKKIHRQFNLLETVTMYVWVEKPGDYSFFSGQDTKITVDKYFYDKSNKRVRKFTKSSVVPLKRGLHKITLTPKIKGIATITIAKKGLFSGSLKNRKKFDKVRSVVQFPKMNLSRKKSYNMLVNSLSPEIGTLILRKLPIDPSEPLTIRVEKGQSITVPMRLSSKSKVEVVWSDGTLCPYMVNNKLSLPNSGVSAGTHSVTIKANKSGFVCLKSTDFELLPNAKPKAFPVGSESPLPIFTQINPLDTIYLDMERNDKRTYEFDVAEPGIYEFTTTGRLRTSLKLRDRFTLNLSTTSENGVGRNAQMLHYLLPGKYQTEVKTLGYSTGKMGLQLALIEKIEGGELTTIQEKRHKVGAGRAITYDVAIDEKGTYLIESQGQSGYFSVRFDDADGWPLIRPASDGQITQTLDSGTYKLVSLSEKYDRIRIARLTQTEERISYVGKGLHTLKLNRGASSIWNEEKNGEVRKSASFKLSVTAPANCKLSLTEDFTAKIYDAQKKELMSWSGTLDTLLPMGELLIEVMADKEENHREYQLSVSTDELVPGTKKRVYGKGTLKVKVGQASVVELLSQGMVDVAATLYDSKGTKQIAYSDDGTNDWNFKISRLLNPGTYTLKITSRGRSDYSSILMKSLQDTLHTDLVFNKSHSFSMAGKINSVEFTRRDDNRIFQAEIDGKSNVGALLERLDGNKWKEIGRASSQKIALAVPVEVDKKYRFSFWSTDHLNENITLRLHDAKVQKVALDKMKRGVRSDVLEGNQSGYMWFLVDLAADSLGHFFCDAKGETSLLGVTATASKDTVFTSGDTDKMVASLSDKIWVCAKIADKTSETFKMKPFVLNEPMRVMVGDNPRAFMVPRKKGMLTVLSAEMKMGTPLCGAPAGSNAFFTPEKIGVQPGSLHYRTKSELVLTPEDKDRAIIWNGDHEKGISAPAPVLLTPKTVSYETFNNVQFGINRLKVKAGKALAIPVSLSANTEIGIALAPRSLALWKRADGSSVLKSSSDEISYVRFTESAGTLYLINGNSESKVMDVECRAIPKQLATSNTMIEGLFEKQMNASGLVTLSVPKGAASSKIFYSGVLKSVDWIGGDGFIVRNIPSGFTPKNMASQGGMLLMHHEKGWIKASCSPLAKAEAKWGKEISSEKGRTISKPEMMLMDDDINWYSISLKDEKHLRLASDESLVALLLVNGKALKCYEGVNGSQFDIPLSKGEYTIGVRGMGSGAIRGGAIDFSLYPIEDLVDTLPLRLTFAPGQSRLVTFDLDTERQIGLGVQTNREVVLVTLLDSDRNVINVGQQQYLSLEKGTYYVQLSVPEESDPAECVVKLFGQNPPADTPPASMVRKFRAYAK